MGKSQHKNWLRLPGKTLGGLAMGSLGFSLIVGAAWSKQDHTSTPAGAPGYYRPYRDSGSPGTGTRMQPAPGWGGSGKEAVSLPPNVMSGWKIRVCSEKTKADKITFKFMPAGPKSTAGTGAPANPSGMGGTGASDTAMGAASAEHTASWARGEATEISVPEELRHAEKIRIEAAPSQKDKRASVCLIYDDHVVKKMNFDDREVSTAMSAENGECGC